MTLSPNGLSWFPKPSAPTDVRIVGAEGALSREELFSLLRDPAAIEWRHKVGIVGPFDGSAKTTSRLLAVNGWVLKTNMALAATTDAGAAAKVEKSADLGARVRLWHPDKTWALLRADDLWYPLSATPELVTLREIESRADKIRAWTAMIERAVDLASEHGIGLDLNPANFARAANDGRLYYLDDEWYPDLKFAEIASAIVARIPEEPAVSAEEWSAWGGVLAQVLRPICVTVDAPTELAAALLDHPVAAQFQEKRAALCGEFRRTVVRASASSRMKRRGRQARKRATAQRTAVIADVHSNIVALEAVLLECEQLRVDSYIFVGDAVGYGPNPRECVQRLAELPNAQFVRGNHDHAIGTGVFKEGMNQLARSSAGWTYEQLSTAERQWLLSMPVEAGGDRWLAVHGAPKDPKRFLAYVYELTFQDNLEHLARNNLRLCFCGHTHVQFVHERLPNGECRKHRAQATSMLGHDRISLINPGSVGQPRDGDPRAAFATWDRSDNLVHFHRAEYAIDVVAARIRERGLPQGLSERLIDAR